MQFRTLEQVQHDHLLEVINRSFSDYIVPFQLTKAELEKKFFVDNIDFRLSAGAFENDELVGFILHGKDIINSVLTAYNSGTGVIPEKRGQKITRQLYDFILPKLREEKIERCLLEVIDQNKPAIDAYVTTGFHITRTLDCLKGTITASGDKNNIHELKSLDWLKLKTFWDWSPSWQNLPRSLEKATDINRAIGYSENGVLLGYAVYNPRTGRVHQFAVSAQNRKKGIATKLFHSISLHVNKEVFTINVDSSAKETLSFLHAIGLRTFIKQYEMELKI